MSRGLDEAGLVDGRVRHLLPGEGGGTGLHWARSGGNPSGRGGII